MPSDSVTRRSFVGGIAAGVAALVFAPAKALLPSADACVQALAPVVASPPVCVYPAGTITFWHRSSVGRVAAFDRPLTAERIRAHYDAAGRLDSLEDVADLKHYAATWDGTKLEGFCNGQPIPSHEVPAYRLARNGVPLIPEWWPSGLSAVPTFEAGGALDARLGG